MVEEPNEQAINGIIINQETLPFTLLAWQTYSMSVANNVTKKLEALLEEESLFQPISFSHNLFKYWFEIGSQVIECGFDSSIGDRKITAFNLKQSKQFKEQLDKIKINMMVFTLEQEDVLITARQEGRLSVTPDISDEQLVSVLELLLSDGITKVIR
jgi:hypothetical protein